MIMEWMHCNNCFQLPDRDNCFVITSCGHIFCKDCEGACARSVCKLCGTQCTAIPLTSSMKPDVQIYFKDPEKLMEEKLKEIQKIIKISTFQKNHRARLLAYYRKELNKYKKMKDAFKKILKNLSDLESERKQITKENIALKRLIDMSGSLQSPYTGFTPGNVKGGTPQDFTPANSHFAKFLNKMDSSNSINVADRVSVFSPPVNGKMGVIPGTPSPTAAMKNMKLNSGQSSERNQNDVFVTPNCSQSTDGGLTQPDSQDAWNAVRNTLNMGNYRRDPRRVVVHPYSPTE